MIQIREIIPCCSKIFRLYMATAMDNELNCMALRNTTKFNLPLLSKAIVQFAEIISNINYQSES